MALYTFIMEYQGGTYISQINAYDIHSAMNKWISKLQVDAIKGFTKKDKQSIVANGFMGEDPILIKGMKNIWYFLIQTKKGIGYVNFVKTNDR